MKIIMTQNENSLDSFCGGHFLFAGMEQVFKELLEVTAEIRSRTKGSNSIPHRFYRRWCLQYCYNPWDHQKKCRLTIYHDGSFPTVHGDPFGDKDVNRVWDSQQFKIAKLYDIIGQLSAQLLEERLRPPELGGSLFEEAKKDYNENYAKRLRV